MQSLRLAIASLALPVASFAFCDQAIQQVTDAMLPDAVSFTDVSAAEAGGRRKLR